jgi:hypothetical protein
VSFLLDNCHSLTQQHLVPLVFPNADTYQRRMKRLQEKGKCHFVGYFDLGDRKLKTWSKWKYDPYKIQHEVNMTTVSLTMDVNELLRGRRIPKPWRKKWRIDGVLKTGDLTFFWEHDEDTEDEDELVLKMRNLSDCPYEILWTVPNETRRRQILELAPNENHYVTITGSDPHEKVWCNRLGEVAAVPRSVHRSVTDSPTTAGGTEAI